MHPHDWIRWSDVWNWNSTNPSTLFCCAITSSWDQTNQTTNLVFPNFVQEFFLIWDSWKRNHNKCSLKFFEDSEFVVRWFDPMSSFQVWCTIEFELWGISQVLVDFSPHSISDTSSFLVQNSVAFATADTDYSLSDALILTSINPKSDDRLFVELLTSSVQENYPLWLLLTNPSR